MSRVLVIGSDTEVSRKIGDALAGANFLMEYSAGHADTLQRLRMRSFGVVARFLHWGSCLRGAIDLPYLAT